MAASRLAAFTKAAQTVTLGFALDSMRAVTSKTRAALSRLAASCISCDEYKVIRDCPQSDGVKLVPVCVRNLYPLLCKLFATAAVKPTLETRLVCELRKIRKPSTKGLLLTC